jgi:cytochrome c peroxidase
MQSAGKYLILGLIFASVGLMAWTIGGDDDEYILEIPKGFPTPNFPENNQLTKSRVELGQSLFFNPIMSRTLTVSCGTCHDPQMAFTDGLIVSEGVENRKGTRNAPTLVNIAYATKILRDGIMPDLERQVIVPIQEHPEFDFNILLIVDRMKKDSFFTQLSRKAYGREPDPYVITRAIASYERTLISGNSPYDQFKFQGKKKALSSAAKKGMTLFNEIGCSNCHSGFNFTNEAVLNIGLYETYVDSGAQRFTKDVKDAGAFKVPTLRNVALTAPYMHDGSIATLGEVIDFFETGGHDHPNKTALMKPLKLEVDDKKNLIAFLEALTDMSFMKAHESD